jgi:triphosphatase
VSELELRDGMLAPLYRLALDLHATVPLTIGPESKADRGYRLRTGQAPAARKAPDLDLDRDVGVPGAFREIVTAGLGHLLANQPAAAAGDPEGVHQMRVAIRRLRTALVLFGTHLKPHATARFEAEPDPAGHARCASTRQPPTVEHFEPQPDLQGRFGRSLDRGREQPDYLRRNW